MAEGAARTSEQPVLTISREKPRRHLKTQGFPFVRLDATHFGLFPSPAALLRLGAAILIARRDE